MTASPLAMLCAAAMLGSIFLPWISTPLGQAIVPWDGLATLDGSRIGELLGRLPPEGLAFLGSFVLAAILLLLGLMGSSPRLIVLLAGALPVGLVAWGLFSAADRVSAMGLPVSGGDAMPVLQDLSRVLGAGAWTWIGSGALLLLIGLFGPGRRRGRA